MFYVALFSRAFWMLGAITSGIIGQIIQFELEVIDFCMTALFVVIFIDQWKAYKSQIPALLGFSVGIVLLFILGQSKFMMPTLILVSGILNLFQGG